MNKKAKQLNMSKEEFFEYLNNMPRKFVLSVGYSALWKMLERQYEGNRLIEKNSIGKILPSKENLQSMGSLYYTAMVLKEEYKSCDPTILNKDYMPDQSNNERDYKHGAGI